MLSGHGAGIVDADAISHELTQAGGSAIEPLRASFGADVIAADGSLDRAQMRALVFSDSTARAQLEALLHPLIRATMRERAAVLAGAGRPYVVFVVPLLVETGSWRGNVSRLLLVDCSEATQIARVRARAAMNEETARAIVASQASRQERLAVADDVLMNEAPIAEIEPRVERLHRAYLLHAS